MIPKSFGPTVCLLQLNLLKVIDQISIVKMCAWISTFTDCADLIIPQEALLKMFLTFIGRIEQKETKMQTAIDTIFHLDKLATFLK